MIARSASLVRVEHAQWVISGEVVGGMRLDVAACAHLAGLLTAPEPEQ